VLSCLSSTSNEAIDWMIIVSTLSAENLSSWTGSVAALHAVRALLTVTTERMR
jgi:hypothetical protein